MANNIAVTVLNKAVFANVDFKYPFALTFVHMAFNTVGSKTYLYVEESRSRALSLPTSSLLSPPAPISKPAPSVKALTRKQTIAVVLFSVIFSLNISIGNVSLRHVSVNL